MQSIKHLLATAFGRYSKQVWRAFFSAVPARLFGIVTIPLVGVASGAYQVQAIWPLVKAVAIYAALGFAWALVIEFQWPQIREFFTGKK